MHSKVHLEKLKAAFKDVATVKVVVSYQDEDDDDNFDEKVEYQFRPLKKGVSCTFALRFTLISDVYYFFT